jgi:type IV pilus assembly protein PilB
MQYKKHDRSTRISKAMRALPRDHFIEMSDPTLVLGRSIPPTNAVSEILNHANVNAEHKVLQIGTGAGYVAALLGKLAAQVVTIEINPAIARFAQNRFNKLSIANLILREQDGTGGAPDLGPYDRILVSSPRIRVTPELLEQLATGGLLIALEQGENSTLLLTRYEVSELGAVLRRELALVDFSRDTGMTLLDMGMVDQVMLSEARSIARQKKQPVIKVLRDKLNLEDTTLYRRLADENGMSFSPVDDLLPMVQPQLMEGFSRSFLDSHHLIPLHVEDHSLEVATDDPDSSIDDILRMYPYDRVNKVLVTPNDFKRLWTTVELSLQGDAKKLWGVAAENLEKQKGEEDLLDREKTRIEARPVSRRT